MGARRQQIYKAVFRAESGDLTRLREDCAASLENVALKKDPKRKVST